VYTNFAVKKRLGYSRREVHDESNARREREKGREIEYERNRVNSTHRRVNLCKRS